MSVPHPAPPVELPTPEGLRPLALPQHPGWPSQPFSLAPAKRRRPRVRTVAMVTAIVVLLVGVATLAGLLVQTHGVLDWQKGQTAVADKRANDTQAKLDDATTQIGTLQSNLSDAQAATDRAKRAAKQMAQCAIAFGRASQDIRTFDYEAQQTCHDAVRDMQGMGIDSSSI